MFHITAMDIPLSLLHVRHFAPYSYSDLNTSRARLPTRLFCRLNIRVGHVLHVRIQPIHPYESYEVLCTAWPDTLSQVPEDMIVIDDSMRNIQQAPGWSTCTCQIIKLYPPESCASVKISASPLSKDLNYVMGMPTLPAGCPVAADFIHTPSGHYTSEDWTHSEKAITVIECRPNISIMQPCNTIVIPVNKDRISISQSYDQTSSKTSVVHDIIRSIIDPIIYQQQTTNYINRLVRGILLIGPPGVGKTYAINAVKILTKDTIKINVHNLSIADALADSDPSK